MPLAAPALVNHGALFARIIVALLLEAQSPELEHLGVVANDQPRAEQQRGKGEDGKPFETGKEKPLP